LRSCKNFRMTKGSPEWKPVRDALELNGRAHFSLPTTKKSEKSRQALAFNMLLSPADVINATNRRGGAEKKSKVERNKARETRRVLIGKRPWKSEKRGKDPVSTASRQEGERDRKTLRATEFQGLPETFLIWKQLHHEGGAYRQKTLSTIGIERRNRNSDVRRKKKIGEKLPKLF